MTRRVLIPSLLIVGLGLLSLGIEWNRISSPSSYWTDEQAKEYTEAHVDLHAKSHEQGSGEIHEQEMAAASERFAKINQQLEAAHRARSRSGTLLTAAGVSCLLLGIGLHFAAGRG